MLLNVHTKWSFTDQAKLLAESGKIAQIWKPSASLENAATHAKKSATTF